VDWADNRPNTDPTNQDDCVYMAPSSVDPGLLWTDANCDYEDIQLIIAPLCQIRTISSTTSIITTTTTATGQGLLVAGGWNGSNYLDVVEIINLESLSSCIVDVYLDQPRYAHTGDGDLVCGGANGDHNIGSCHNIVTGTNISLIDERFLHLSWSTGQEILLLGGAYTSRTTELITGDTTQAGFDLKYDTYRACGFADEDDDTFIITGGEYTGTTVATVSRYNKNGWMEDLPSLNTGRRDHACGSYLNNDGNRIYLVTGGYDGNDLSSTEMMVKGDSSWSEVQNSLPARMSGLRIISGNNEIITSGGYDVDAGEYSDKILMFNKETREFEQIGKLEQRRNVHSMSLVSLSDYTCQ